MQFDHTTETIHPDLTNLLTIGGTGGLEIPMGTTAQRPVDAIPGTLRYNTTTEQIEIKLPAAGEWTNVPVPTFVEPGTYTKVTVNVDGQIISGENPTTLAGYGITDAAPTNAPYVTIGTSSALSGERSLVGTTSEIEITDGGANSTVSVGIADNPILPGTGGVRVPSGTTGERPTGVDGVIRYNTTIGRLEGYVDGEWVGIVLTNSTEVAPAETLVVQKNPGVGQFGSVAAAIASITDATAEKPYSILVKPGVYVEPQIVMKEHIAVLGSGISSTVIQSQTPSENLIVGARFCTLQNLTLTGATGTGRALIHFDQPAGDIQNSFICFNILFGSAYQLVRCLRGSIQLTNISIGGQYTFVRGFSSENTTTGSRLVLRNVFSTRMSTPYPEYLIKVDGINAFSVVTGLFNRARGAGVGTEVDAGVGLWMRNGSQMRMQSASILGYDKGIWIENAGSGPQANFNGVLLDANVEDLVVDHPDTTGSFQGTLSGSRSSDAAPGFAIQALDDEIVGTRITGKLFIGGTLSEMTDVTDLIQRTSAVGVISGGELTLGTNALEIDVSAGFGYRSDPETGNGERFEWDSTTVTAPNNQFNFVYINGSGAVVFSQTRPDYLTNLILGVVYTRGGVIERLTAAKFDSLHKASKIGNYLRTVIGTVVTSGLTASAGTSPLKVNISAGAASFGTFEFTKTSKTDIQFLTQYHSSGAWVNGTLINELPVNQYDNLTNLVSLTTGYYTKHTLYVSAGVGTVEFYLVYGQGEYATVEEARAAPLPTVPPTLTIDTVPVAAFVVQEGGSDVAEYIDIRPRIRTDFQVAAGGAGSSDHGELTGLEDDDHPQYLPLTGTRAMTGALNMGTNAITNVTTVSGVSPTAHGSRHAPNGADPIATGTAVELNTTSTNAAGTANTLARSDHTHRIDGFQPLDSDLTALAGTTTTGLYTRTGTGTSATRTIDGTSNQIAITNGSGVSGNPTIAIATNPVLPGTG
jgi:hypothetical protein